MASVLVLAILAGRRIVARFVRDEHGQDLIEYGLLFGIIATGTIALMPALQSSISTAYQLWSTGRNNLWIPPLPAS